jgi:hypothetical protein
MRIRKVVKKLEGHDLNVFKQNQQWDNLAQMVRQDSLLAIPVPLDLKFFFSAYNNEIKLSQKLSQTAVGFTRIEFGRATKGLHHLALGSLSRNGLRFKRVSQRQPFTLDGIWVEPDLGFIRRMYLVLDCEHSWR